MRTIILDTNFLLIPGQFGVDIFSEIDRIMNEAYELCIVDSTIDELNKLRELETGKNKAASALALQLLKKKEVRTLKTEKHLNTDKLIEKLAKSPECIVATQDKALKAILKQNNNQLIVLRQKKFLKLF